MEVASVQPHHVRPQAEEPPCSCCDWLIGFIRTILEWLYSCCTSTSIRIIDAKEMRREEVLQVVNDLTRRELFDTLASILPSTYIRQEYFDGIPMAPGAGIPETIFIAKKIDQVVGFLILAKKPEKTGWVSYLAVDSQCKKSGIGTQLMLSAMKKTKEAGKSILVVSYTEKQPASAPQDLQQRAIARSQFYNKFTTKYHIPTTYNRYLWHNGRVIPPEQATGNEEHSLEAYFDLTHIDIDAIIRANG